MFHVKHFYVILTIRIILRQDVSRETFNYERNNEWDE